MQNLVTITYDSTHYYLVPCKNGRLLVDCGMAGTYPKLRNRLQQAGIRLDEIRYVMMTHHHPDHAGILQEIRQAARARLLILEKQVPYLDDLREFYRKKGSYLPVTIEPDDRILTSDNRAALETIGIAGEIVETPGHSPDSVSLVLDSGEAFIGDLNPYHGEPGQEAEWRASWDSLIQRKAGLFFPAHAPPVGVEEIKKILSQVSG